MRQSQDRCSLGAAADLALEGMGKEGRPGRVALNRPTGSLEGWPRGLVLGNGVDRGPSVSSPLSSPTSLPRYHKVGILVLFLHDISDVQLEFTKLNVYFKSRGGSHHRLHALAADLGCLSFSLSW